ncbi:hypothetical protein BDZ45DRAFT_759702, partial [Acephala macrosclerotiorum]
YQKPTKLLIRKLPSNALFVRLLKISSLTFDSNLPPSVLSKSLLRLTLSACSRTPV